MSKRCTYWDCPREATTWSTTGLPLCRLHAKGRESRHAPIELVQAEETPIQVVGLAEWEEPVPVVKGRLE